MIISAPLLLRGGRLVGPGAVVIEADRIATVLDRLPAGASDHVALDRGVLSPGLIDLHNNGAFDVDFAVSAPSAWGKALAELASLGVTSVMPTVITAPLTELLAAATRVALAAEHLAGRSLARILGLHLEGPFLSPARAGAHRAGWMTAPSEDAIAVLLGDPLMARVLRLITLAPELPGAIAAIRRFVAAGVIVSLGHTDASPEQVAEATAAGARVVTHLFNAQRPFAHRAPGVPGAVLTEPRLTLCLVADGEHVHPLALRLAFQAAGERIAVVSDSVLLAGLPEGSERMFGGTPVRLDKAGIGRRPDGTIAGSAITLDEAVRRLIGFGLSPAQALAAASEIPARAIGRHDLGRLAEGALADLVWWDEAFRPCRVWIGGVALDSRHG